MRKLLLSTTALAAAATLSANALADVSISGYTEFNYQSRSSNVAASDGTSMGSDSEIKISFSNKTDSGLDIDALKLVAKGITETAKETGFLVITHYQRLLELIKPNFVHAMIDGKFVKSGGPELALKLEDQGYDWLEA